jgi:hypothetical protein
MAETLRERCHRRLRGLQEIRLTYEPEWKEVASYCQPARSRFLNTQTNRRASNKKLNSSHGIFAFRTLQGGMTSGLSSQSRPWFALATYDEAMMEDPQVREWLHDVEKRMYAFLAQTNFYGAVKTGYLEMGLFGTEACVAVEHPREGMVCHQLTAGEYWIGLANNLQPDALYRRCPMTVNQAVGKFGLKKVSSRIRDMYDRSDLDQVCNYYHAIEANDDRLPKLVDARGMPFRGVYWDEDDDSLEKSVCGQSGYQEQPFWAPRWDTTGADAWGVGPASDALPDLRELQLQAKRKAEATDLHVWPEIVVPPKIKLKRQPRSVVHAAAIDIEGISVPYQVPYQAIEAIRVDIERCEQSINQASYADLFMAITNMQGIQPRNIEEIAARNEEKLTQLGPVIERVNNEKLEVAIERIYGIMERGGLLPPAPPTIADAGGELKIEFVSILTQMQRMVGLGQIERTISFVATQMAVFPELKHKIDAFEMVDEYAERAGAPSKIIVPSDKAREAAGAEAQAAQQAQMAEMMGKMAPAASVAVDAAALASQVPQSGIPAVQDMVPVVPR